MVYGYEHPGGPICGECGHHLLLHGQTGNGCREIIPTAMRWWDCTCTQFVSMETPCQPNPPSNPPDDQRQSPPS